MRTAQDAPTATAARRCRTAVSDGGATVGVMNSVLPAAPRTDLAPHCRDYRAHLLPRSARHRPARILWIIARGILLTGWYTPILIVLAYYQLPLTALAAAALLVVYLLAPPRGRRHIRVALAWLPLVLTLPMLLLFLTLGGGRTLR